MTLVVADTGPINYLHLIGELKLLPALYGEIIIAPAVLAEMSHPKAPAGLQSVAASPPSWLKVRQPVNVRFLDQLDDGEAEAISLAMELGANRLLIDERAGRSTAASLGLQFSGTLGILEEAAEQRLVSLPLAFAALRQTNYRVEPALLDAALKRDADRRSRPR
jgi:predicted nucleic acid-binding protein